MNQNNLAPHLKTVQRNQLSKQIQDGFLIFHIEKDQYEQWDKTTRTWNPLLDRNNNSQYVQGGNIDDYDHFILNSLPQTVTQVEALDDWLNS